MGKTLEQFIKDANGRRIVITGMSTAECVALFWAFNREVGTAETYSARGACNLWTTEGGDPYIWETYDRVTTGYRRGDFLVWSGKEGAYPNGGFGHIAALLKLYGDGTGDFLSQNPGATSVRRLSLSGVMGALRYKGIAVKPTSTPAPRPPAKPKTSLLLPAAAASWNVYPVGKAPVRGNQVGTLAPARFGGLRYTIKGWPQKNVALIDTRDFGRVKIYVGPETGAVIS
ncbi:hypothetical protein [Arthrobacter silvisoli]|uniref:hypothetical protein n=1 Tax=Arthrobacter silvisoli TaxID=2291022 RepID=UPI000E2192F8|nr:hypothetical protein [Arthrobacter silvisoli]